MIEPRSRRARLPSHRVSSDAIASHDLYTPDGGRTTQTIVKIDTEDIVRSEPFRRRNVSASQF